MVDSAELMRGKRKADGANGEEEEMMMWSGPKKLPRKHIGWTEQVPVREPVYRMLRRTMQIDRAMTKKGASPSVGEKESTDKEGGVGGGKISSKDTPNMPVINHATNGENLNTPCAYSHIPRQDPLCHVPLVTPPCPINPADTVTPPEGQLYTHVSYSPITHIKTQTYQNRTVPKKLKCITKNKDACIY